jgi:Tfp pilus assembly protein PilZ
MMRLTCRALRPAELHGHVRCGSLGENVRISERPAHVELTGRVDWITHNTGIKADVSHHKENLFSRLVIWFEKVEAASKSTTVGLACTGEVWT